MCASCATRKKIEYVDREVIKNVVSVQHDTVVERVKDSVYHNVLQKGDTVYDTKYIQKIVYKYQTVYAHDTITKDSIRTEYKEITVEKKIIPKWCYYSLVAWLCVIIFIILKIRKWAI